MGQSLTKVYLHIVFGTKWRKPLLRKPHDVSMHKYLWTVSRDLGYIPIAIGGHLDHVHILCVMSPKRNLSDFMQKLKSNSSRWVKDLDPSLREFAWQDGYGAFSVSEYAVEIVKKYIMNQEEHHRKKDFKEVVEKLFKESDLDYDSRYFWR